MSDLTERLAGVHERLHEVGNIGYWQDYHTAGETISESQADVAPLLAAVEAVLNTVERHPVPSKRDDPTGGIGGAVEAFGRAVERAITEHLDPTP